MRLQELPFPFQTTLCFEPLIDYIKSKHQQGPEGLAPLAAHVLDQLEQHPELCHVITDSAVLERHRGLIEQMMAFVFSPVEIDRDILAATVPFQPMAFFTSPAWDAMNLHHPSYISSYSQTEGMERMKHINANRIIFKHIYGQEINSSYKAVFTLPSGQAGLNRYYRVEIIPDFARVKVLGEVPQLSEKEVRLLKSDFQDLDRWRAYLPPENFEIQGFVVLKFTDITESEVISSLKNDLLRKDSFTSRERFPLLEQKVRELFQLSDLRLGVVLFDEAEAKRGKHGPKIWNSIIPRHKVEHMSPEEFEGCTYHKMMEQRAPMIVEDLQTYEEKTRIEEAVLEVGIRNILLAPLMYEGKAIGGLELGSPIPGDLDASAMLLLQDIMPIFTLAGKRSLEELENEVEAQIKEDFTAIHPAVEWRFREVASQKLIARGLGEPREDEAIVFDEIYPIYGLSDIRGSSSARNEAIQADLTAQLELAKELLQTAYQRKPLPIIDETMFRIESYQAEIASNMGSGDELAILFFFEQTVAPVLDHFRSIGLLREAELERYTQALDQELGIVYQKRKAFEDSVTTLNEMISRYLDEQEHEAQAMFPHYYERYKTDGVEYNIYLGQSMVQDQVFDLLYLRNLRLWQLSVTCQITRLSSQLKEVLPMPLETTQLILVHSSPISIRFREDEKQFDVDGAYNIRYEIVKKRIDKARIKGSSERLTQPGMIAIVYSQSREAREYMEYIKYLQQKGLLEKEVEDLALEALQGANGLKALRVKVTPQAYAPVAEASSANHLTSVNS